MNFQDFGTSPVSFSTTGYYGSLFTMKPVDVWMLSSWLLLLLLYSLLVEFAVCTVAAVIEFMHLKRAWCEHKKKEKTHFFRRQTQHSTGLLQSCVYVHFLSETTLNVTVKDCFVLKIMTIHVDNLLPSGYLGCFFWGKAAEAWSWPITSI